MSQRWPRFTSSKGAARQRTPAMAAAPLAAGMQSALAAPLLLRRPPLQARFFSSDRAAVSDRFLEPWSSRSSWWLVKSSD